MLKKKAEVFNVGVCEYLVCDDVYAFGFFLTNASVPFSPQNESYWLVIP